MAVEIKGKKYKDARKKLWFTAVGELPARAPYRIYVGQCRKPVRLDIRHFLCPDGAEIFDVPSMSEREVRALALELSRPPKKEPGPSKVSDWNGAAETEDFYYKLGAETMTGGAHGE